MDWQSAVIDAERGVEVSRTDAPSLPLYRGAGTVSASETSLNLT